MGRTRAALLSGAARAVSAGGTRITMSQVATCSGVAKATLYNHFRTREAVLAAVLEYEVTTLIGRVEHRPLDQALIEVAHDLSIHPVLRALAKLEPATIAALARVDLNAGSWQLVHDAVATALARAGVGAPNVVLRWLASYVVTPASYEEICEQVPILLAGLPIIAEASGERANAGREPDQIQSQSA